MLAQGRWAGNGASGRGPRSAWVASLVAHAGRGVPAERVAVPLKCHLGVWASKKFVQLEPGWALVQAVDVGGEGARCDLEVFGPRWVRARGLQLRHSRCHIGEDAVGNFVGEAAQDLYGWGQLGGVRVGSRSSSSRLGSRRLRGGRRSAEPVHLGEQGHQKRREPPMTRQSRSLRGWKKLAANSTNRPVLMITKGHNP